MGPGAEGALTSLWAESVSQAVMSLLERTAVCRRLIAEGEWIKLAETIGDPAEEAAWTALGKLLADPSGAESERQQVIRLLSQLKEQREEVRAQVRAMHGRTLAAILALQRSRNLLSGQVHRAAGSLLDLKG